jgi:hypothetical protein
MALQTFTAGQVLTAAQVNALQANDYNQTVSTKTGDYVLVAADKGTRVVMNSASATTITVDTSLFSAGDTLFIQNIGAGICTITAGTATVSTAGSLALAENAGGTLYFTSTGVSIFFPSAVATTASGLTLINTTTFSAVASQSVNNVFSATYDNYRILVEIDTVSAGGGTGINMRLRVGGADNTSANYFNQRIIGQTTNVTASGAASADTAWTSISEYDNVGISTSSFDLFAPFRTATTSLHGTGQFRYTSSYQYSLLKTGQTTVTTSYTGFTILPPGGTMTGKVRVYGYNQ